MCVCPWALWGVLFLSPKGCVKWGSVLETVFWGVLVVGVAVVLAVVGQVPARRLVPLDVRESHNANTATMFGALYVTYGLIVGFSALLVANQYNTAERTAQSEANSVEEIYRIAEGFPEPKRGEVQGLARSYARTVLEDGWSLMKEGRVSVRAGDIAGELRRGIVSFEPGTEGEDVIYAQALTLVADLDEYRAQRTLEVREGIPRILWVVLLVGGVFTIGFTYLFGMRTPGLHVFMICALTIILALVLFTIRALEYPFDGIVQVGPDAFEAALARMEQGR
jgi:hypothetical protein